jgi:hypothetical protein
MQKMHKTKAKQFAGTSYVELIKRARHEYHPIQKKTPRRVPYIRSAYFKKDKIFVNNFWDHLNQKSPQDRVRRLKLYACAVELIRNATSTPDSMQNPNNREEILHRFDGLTADGMHFAVQIKENKKTHRKDFISCFPRQ